MKRFAILLFASSFFAACSNRPAGVHAPDARIIAAEDATCSGSDNYCNACKNCKYCKHCSKDGGTCKVCK